MCPRVAKDGGRWIKTTVRLILILFFLFFVVVLNFRIILKVFFVLLRSVFFQVLTHVVVALTNNLFIVQLNSHRVHHHLHSTFISSPIHVSLVFFFHIVSNIFNSFNYYYLLFIDCDSNIRSLNKNEMEMFYVQVLVSPSHSRKSFVRHFFRE